MNLPFSVETKINDVVRSRPVVLGLAHKIVIVRGSLLSQREAIT